jgi:di/tricarboxylate transporter
MVWSCHVMNTDLIILFTLLFFVFAFLIWGRWRYDLVAFMALVVALLTGVVPVEQAFVGFGHPATIIIALVLIVSRALSNSGAVELLAHYVLKSSKKIGTHISLMAGVSAILSAFMNNVAALALLMPVDLQAAAKAKRSPALTLMPLSFATILGGMITLIGTPPNIVIAQYRNDALGAPFKMFDFAPVGAACALMGVLYIATIGWRLIPIARREHDSSKELFDIEDYIAEVKVSEGSSTIGKKVSELDDAVEENEAEIVGLVRRGHRMPGLARRVEVAKGDVLVLKAKPDGIDKLVGELGLEYARSSQDKGTLTGDELALMEVVVPEGARIEGRSAFSHRLLYRYGVTLLGISRQGKRFTERVRKVKIQAGDILLLLGPGEQLPEITDRLGCLPLAERGLQVIQRRKAGMAIGIFAAAVLLASIGVLHLPIALASAAVLMVLLNIVPLRQVYESVEWSVIVLLGAMIPIGAALETSGGTELIAESIVNAAAGFPPVVVLVLLIVVTMTLSDVMNNTATAVIAAPIAVDIASRLGVNSDPFLMGVAVAASCAFLTPIGHKNNTLILGPGGYRFGDYWRMGLPLEILIVLVATPMILLVWPF